MQRCPCCKARLKGAVSCPRCKAELQEILRVQQLAKFWYLKAIDCYCNNEMQCCLDALTRSLQLRHSESAMLFRGFVIERQKQTSGLFDLHRIVQDVILFLKPLVKSLINNLADRLDVIYLQAKKSNNAYNGMRGQKNMNDNTVDEQVSRKDSPKI